MSYQSLNPLDRKPLQPSETMSDQKLETALATAAACFETWRTTSFAERAAVARRAAAIMRTRVDQFARPVTIEMGDPIERSRGEVTLSAEIIAYYARNAEAFLKPDYLHPGLGEAAAIESSPIGVLWGVESWNLSCYQRARFAAPNLMAGNVIIMQHAGRVPPGAIAFERLWSAAGAPAGAYTNLRISHDQLSRVIDDPRINGVALTGSVEPRRSETGRVAPNPHKSATQQGGGDAFIVLEDADLETTIEWAVRGTPNNTGQCCVPARRFIVVEALADRFLAAFRTELGALQVADPIPAAIPLGPPSSEGALLTLLDQVDEAVAYGGAVVMGGQRIARPGPFTPPIMIADNKPANLAFREEVFGPVALFFRAKDEDEAVALANASEFGLRGGVFTRDVARGKRVASRVDTGAMFVNRPTWTTPDLPAGGISNAGWGRKLSTTGIQEFVNKRLVRLASTNSCAPGGDAASIQGSNGAGIGANRR